MGGDDRLGSFMTLEEDQTQLTSALLGALHLTFGNVNPNRGMWWGASAPHYFYFFYRTNNLHIY